MSTIHSQLLNNEQHRNLHQLLLIRDIENYEPTSQKGYTMSGITNYLPLIFFSLEIIQTGIIFLYANSQLVYCKCVSSFIGSIVKEELLLQEIWTPQNFIITEPFMNYCKLDTKQKAENHIISEN